MCVREREIEREKERKSGRESEGEQESEGEREGYECRGRMAKIDLEPSLMGPRG